MRIVSSSQPFGFFLDETVCQFYFLLQLSLSLSHHNLLRQGNLQDYLAQNGRNEQNNKIMYLLFGMRTDDDDFATLFYSIPYEEF